MNFLVQTVGLTKAYGPTVAVRSVSCAFRRGAVTALLGGNGAGKSTLVRLLSGETPADGGQLWLDSRPVSLPDHSVPRAKRAGLRVVHQELSVCTNLSIAENCYLEMPGRFAARGWRGHAAALMERALAAVFPDHGLGLTRTVGDLTLAQQQMVEIARATADPDLKLLILDEPTSSLDATRAEQLQTYLRRRVAEGLSVIYIGHKLTEILELAEDFLVMRDGQLVWTGPREETSYDRLVALMSQAGPGENGAGKVADPAGGLAGNPNAGGAPRPTLVEVGRRWGDETAAPVRLQAGEIVGLTGLEGSGQQRLLDDIFAAPAKGWRDGGTLRHAAVAYVTGDRRKEGVFPGWSTLRNMTVARYARQAPWRPVRTSVERTWAESWRERFRFTRSALEQPILQLSGGNQQKALMSRALIAEAAVILLNDPTRGVDVGVKREFYEVLRAAAAGGKLVVWYSSEDAEFRECSRVLVLREGRVAAQYSGREASRENLVSACFTGPPSPGRATGATGAAPRRRTDGLPHWLIPLAALVLVLAATGFYNPRALSPFGLGLLLGTALPLVLVALGQMFVVGRSEIDLGVGAFAGLVNVISATLLVERPLLGGLALVAALIGYGLLGWVIHARQIPAIVATLGNAFVWTGIGYVLQPAPGGSSPAWLSAVFNRPIPYVPVPIWLIVAGTLAAVGLTRSRLGVVQRGFGNNEVAMRQLGWPAARAHVATYLLGAVFTAAAGLCLTGVNTAADVNAASSYTLLSVAAVVMGGCDLVGGRIEPLGGGVRRHHPVAARHLAGVHAVEFGQHGRPPGNHPDRDRRSAHRPGTGPGRMMKTLFQRPWVWALLGVGALWGLLSLGTGRVNLGNLSGILASAALLSIVATGQMIVVTTGGGAVDLSIPSVMTLAGFVATSLVNGQDARLPLGLGAVLALGAGVGWVNALIINALRIPPVIATLAVGYILTTATLVLNRGFMTYAVSPRLSFVAGGRVLGFPVILLLAGLLAAGVSWLLHGTVYGRRLSAVGQNRRAAHFAGIRVEATTRTAYVLSGVLAAVGGLLLSGRVSGAFLQMGDPFLLPSLGAVVVGGTAILGGRGTALGTLIGSVFLSMIVTTMAVLRVVGGFQDVVQGLFIILVLAVATRRRPKSAPAPRLRSAPPALAVSA